VIAARERSEPDWHSLLSQRRKREAAFLESGELVAAIDLNRHAVR